MVFASDVTNTNGEPSSPGEIRRIVFVKYARAIILRLKPRRATRSLFIDLRTYCVYRKRAVVRVYRIDCTRARASFGRDGENFSVYALVIYGLRHPVVRALSCTYIYTHTHRTDEVGEKRVKKSIIKILRAV